jgi:hypothetical protein
MRQAALSDLLQAPGQKRENGFVCVDRGQHAVVGIADVDRVNLQALVGKQALSAQFPQRACRRFPRSTDSLKRLPLVIPDKTIASAKVEKKFLHADLLLDDSEQQEEAEVPSDSDGEPGCTDPVPQIRILSSKSQRMSDRKRM